MEIASQNCCVLFILCAAHFNYHAVDEKTKWQPSKEAHIQALL